MPYIKLFYRIFISYAIYTATATIGIYSINLGIPIVLEKIFTIFAIPLFLSILPFLPFFNKYHLLNGEWIRLPNVIGLVILVITYSVLSHTIIVILMILIKRLKRSH